MKTTVELPDELVIAAKKRAAELRRSLRSLIEAGLRAELDNLDRTGVATPPDIRWVTVDGGLPDGLDLADRSAMGDWMTRERGRR